MALAGVLAWPGAAAAGLGPIRVLSAPGAPFSALIPLVDTPPDGDIQIGLADRNRYPMLSPYSLSAPRLDFVLQHGADGRATGILVSGPADLSESELDFAVSMHWQAGGAVREYQVLRANRLAASFGVPEHVLPAGSFASLGMGELHVAFAPGQAFAVEAELFGVPRGSERSLRVRVVPEAGMSDQPEAQARLLAALRHAIDHRPDGAPILRLSAPQSLQSARLAFRIDLAVGRAHMARRYLMSAHGAGYVVAEQTLSGPASAFRVLRVASGDSLSRIAARLRPGSVSLPQAMNILHRDNPHAFSAGDRDRLLAGVELKYPESWSVSARVEAPAANRSAPATPAGVTTPSRTAVAAAALRARLREQDRLLSQAHATSSALQARLQALQHQSMTPARPQTVTPTVAGKTADTAGRSGAAPVPLPDAHKSAVATGKASTVQKPVAAGSRPLAAAHKPVAASASDGSRTPAAVHKPAAASKPQAAPEKNHLSALPGGMLPWAGGTAALLAAATTALALRRRRLRQGARAQKNSDEMTSPTVEGMRQWLRYDPTRDDLRYRLLQLLASQDDRQGFIVEAEEARSRFDPEGAMWQGVLQMGRELAPDYPWLADAGTTQSDAPEQEIAVPERPLDGMGELEALIGTDVVFREDLAPPVVEELPPELPEPVDTRALAQLYLEMGDTAAAAALLRPN